MSRFVLFVAAFFLSFGTSSVFAFGPCSPVFPEGLSYLPAAEQCGGDAAVVVWGRYRRAFSVVVRDCNNNDRDPCNKSEASCASNDSSPFKANKILSARIMRKNKEIPARVFCLNEPGTSEVYKLVRRITIKLRNPVRSDADVAKICLRTRVNAVRAVEILSSALEQKVGKNGYSAVCEAQPYLNCSIAYADICPQY